MLLYFFKFSLVTYLRNENGLSVIKSMCVYFGFTQPNRLNSETGPAFQFFKVQIVRTYWSSARVCCG